MEKKYSEYTPDELARMRASGIAGESNYRKLRAKHERAQELGSAIWLRAGYLVAKAIGRPNTEENWDDNIKVWNFGKGPIVDQEANKEAIAIERQIAAAFADLPA